MSFYPDTDEGVTTTAPFRRRVGHEVEINNCGERYERAFVEYLWDHGYGTPRTNGYGRGLHGYHCRCRHANNYPIHTTHDGTAPGGEHIIGGTKGVLFASPAYMEAIGAISEAGEATGGQGDRGTGGHIHVSMKGVGKVKAVHMWRNLTALWPQIRELASGPWDEVRSNGNMNPPTPGEDLVRVNVTNPEFSPPDRWGYSHIIVPGDLWTCDPRKVKSIQSLSSAFRFRYVSRMPKTIEFRVWNTTVSRWRLYMSAGVSAAIVEAAAQGRTLEQGADTDLLDHLDGLLTADLVVLVERQRAILRGDFSMAA